MSADRVREISIQGFKSIASISINLNPINILIGANGSGKSNFLGAFTFLREIGAGRLRNYVKVAGGAEKVLHFGSKTTERIHLHVTFNEKGFHPISPAAYDLTLAPTADDDLFPADEQFLSPSDEQVYWGAYPRSLTQWQSGLEAGIGNPDSEAFTKGARQEFEGWQLYHLHDTSYMRKTASIRDNDFLRANGSNLPAFLYYLRERWPESYRLILRAVQQVTPFFGDFQLAPDRKNPDSIQLVWRHKDSDQYFYASSLSDGTLRFIALATLFLQPLRHRSLILVDEPELGLHPYSIELLASLIRQAAVDTQIVISTQSASLLDNFKPEDILVADRIDGATQLTRRDSASLAEWLEDYSLGELWEKNEIGGRPGSH